jgi:hypothetical protein
VSEIYDGANRELLEQTVADDVIVSPDMVSLQLAQISRELMLASIYREILTAGGIEVRLQPAGRYVALDGACRFRDLVAACQTFAEFEPGQRRVTRIGG